MNPSLEQLKKARLAKNAQELLTLAQAEGFPLTSDEARAQFARLHPPMGELSDHELEDVSGGGCGPVYESRYDLGDMVTLKSSVTAPVVTDHAKKCPCKQWTVLDCVWTPTYSSHGLSSQRFLYKLKCSNMECGAELSNIPEDYLV